MNRTDVARLRRRTKDRGPGPLQALVCPLPHLPDVPVAGTGTVGAEPDRQEPHLRSVLDGLDEPLFSVDTRYRYTSFNRSHAAVMKTLYGADIRIGQSLLEYQAVAEDRTKAKAHLDRALKGERTVEEAHSGEGAARRYFEVTHSPVRSSDSAVTGVVVLVRDITDRKRKEDELRESEDRFKHVFDYSVIGESITAPSARWLSTGLFARCWAILRRSCRAEPGRRLPTPRTSN